jgi:MFS family permease
MNLPLNFDLVQQIQTTFRSLKYRNYRLFFFGQGLSLIGTWMQQVAVSWLVYRLTDSAMALGLIAFAGQIPSFVLAPVGGIAADRYSKHRILLVTQALSMIQASVLAWLTLSGKVDIWDLGLLSMILGVINAFDMPTRQAFVIEMIENNEDLGNAIALNSSMFNGARLVGPTLAGILISTAGESVCFVVNAVSYLAVIVSLLRMRMNPLRHCSTTVHPLKQLREAFVYAHRFSPIKYMIGFIGLISLVGLPYVVVIPIFASEVLHGGSQTYGLLLGATGTGALIGALYMAARKTVLGLGKLLAFSGMFFGAALMLFSLSASLWLSMGLLLLAGFGMMVLMASCNTLLQTMVEDDKRGMVMSFYMMAFMGMAPLGSLLAGFLAHRLGVHAALLIGGACCVLGSGLFARKLPFLREQVRPVYIKKGIIKELAQGLQSATGLTMPPEK